MASFKVLLIVALMAVASHVSNALTRRASFSEDVPAGLMKYVRDYRSAGSMYPVMMRVNTGVRFQAQELPIDEPIADDAGLPTTDLEPAAANDEPILGQEPPVLKTDIATNGNGNENIAPESKASNGIYNTYFPISFGKSVPSSLAIANSFSSGKRGSSVSHATAHGGAPTPA